MKIKRIIKNGLTLIYHPLLSVSLMLEGTKNFYISPRTIVSHLKLLKIGDNFTMGRDSRFLFVKEYHGGKYIPKAVIGKSVTIGNRFSLLSAALIEIGDECLIASDVLITSENHGMEVEGYTNYGQTPLIAKSVKIGNGCWIGEKATILPGVELGERCIVAAGAVVTNSFPAFSLIGGVPARLIKKYDFETHNWVSAK